MWFTKEVALVIVFGGDVGKMGVEKVAHGITAGTKTYWIYSMSPCIPLAAAHFVAGKFRSVGICIVD